MKHCWAKGIRRHRRAGFVSTGVVLKLLSFLLTAARTVNRSVALYLCGWRSPIRGDCGVERKRRFELVESILGVISTWEERVYSAGTEHSNGEAEGVFTGSFW